jgi:hypothetical protein
MCVLLAAAILAILIRNHMAFVDNATGAADPIAQAGKRRKTVTGPPTSAGIDLASIGLIPPESVVIEDEIVVQYWSSRSHIYGRPEAQNTADSP